MLRSLSYNFILISLGNRCAILGVYARLLYALVCGLFVSRWVLAAEKSEFGVCGVVGGMMVVVLLAFAMRRVRGGIAAVMDVRQTYTAKHIQTLLTSSGSF